MAPPSAHFSTASLTRRTSRWRFGAYEVALIAVLVAIVTWVGARHWFVAYSGPTLVDEDLATQFEQRFGVERFSMAMEEWIIRDFFDDRRGGTFVDVGAWDPVKGSNTYRLERDFGWSGVAVDAIEEFAPRYKAGRARSRFVTAFVSDADEGLATLHLPRTLTAVASGSSAFAEQFEKDTVPRQVPKRTLDSILSEHGIEKIDLLSMDIELSEPAALRGFSIRLYQPKLVCIEAHGETRQAILDYFAANDYVLVGRYLPHDRVNLYFMPAGAKPSSLESP